MLLWAYYFLGLALKPVQVGEKMQLKQLNRNQFYSLFSNDEFWLKFFHRYQKQYKILYQTQHEEYVKKMVDKLCLLVHISCTLNCRKCAITYTKWQLSVKSSYGYHKKRLHRKHRDILWQFFSPYRHVF